MHRHEAVLFLQKLLPILKRIFLTNVSSIANPHVAAPMLLAADCHLNPPPTSSTPRGKSLITRRALGSKTAGFQLHFQAQLNQEGQLKHLKDGQRGHRLGSPRGSTLQGMPLQGLGWEKAAEGRVSLK